jgi:hypothetical protein
MDDKNKEQSQGESKAIQLVITIDGDGIRVDGPIRNEPLCIWLLEKAKGVVYMHNMQQNEPKVVRPGGIMNFMRGKK